MKKKIFFFLYCVLIIGGLILFLIFTPKFIMNDDTDKTETTINQSNNSNGQTENDENISETYATKIKLNCEDDITLSIGTSVQLLSGYITILPNTCEDKVFSSITTEAGAINGITFTNNIISANKEGRYRITFYVPKSENEQIYDFLIVRVVNVDDDNKVKLLNNNFTLNTTIPLNGMVEIDEAYSDISIITNNDLNYDNNQLTFNSVGTSNLELVLNTTYFKYNYSFGYTVNEPITSGIVITGENNGVVEIDKNVGEYFYINYIVKSESGESISQYIEIDMDNETSIQIMLIKSPVITCKILSKSNVKLTITSTDLDIPTKELTIVFK